MNWKNEVHTAVIDWLLEDDPTNPSVCYLTLVNLLDVDPQSSRAKDARKNVVASGPVADILAKQHSDGYWVEPGSGYSPKYTSTVWSLIMLSQLGVDCENDKVHQACDYVLDHTRAEIGCFSVHATQTGTAHCLQGNLAASLIQLGMLGDERLWTAIDWMARSVTGDGFGKSEEKDVHPRFMRSGISGPGLLCSANDHQPCSWGAVKVALAFSKIPVEMRSSEISSAIYFCKTFLLSVNPASAEYPHPYAKNPNSGWFKFGFPIFYVTDLLQNVFALTSLGLAGDERLLDAVKFVESKQDDFGRWKMDYSYNGKTWVEIEEKNQPSKWVTYRALSALKKYYS